MDYDKICKISTDGRQVWKEIAVEENHYAQKHGVQSVLSKEIEIRTNIKEACWQKHHLNTLIERSTCSKVSHFIYQKASFDLTFRFTLLK